MHRNKNRLMMQKILKLEDFADLASDELTGGHDVIKGERVKIQGYLDEFGRIIFTFSIL